MSAFIPPLLGLIGLLIALGLFRVVLSYPEGNPEVKKIGDMIHSGAMSFMKTEYMYLVVFVLVLAVLVFFALRLGNSNCSFGWCFKFSISWIYWNVCCY